MKWYNDKSREYLTFDDVLLVPQYSELASRSEANTSTVLGALRLEVPILSANMDTITDFKMAEEMGLAGAAGVLHRYTDADTIRKWVKDLVNSTSRPNFVPAIPSVGVQDYDIPLAYSLRSYTEHICMDIAHGNSKRGVEMVKFLKKTGFKTIIAGNVATSDGARRLIEAGANVIKVGIGPGSVCATRGVTGHGFPQLEAINDVAEMIARDYPGVHLIADGGLKSSGDIVKALAAGADAVMTGSLFAGSGSCPRPGVYRGMASQEAQGEFLHKSAVAPEGITTYVLEKPTATHIVKSLAAGIRSGMSYSGARNLTELRENAVFVRVSSNVSVENGTRQP